jgi:hypothetical protein
MQVTPPNVKTGRQSTIAHTRLSHVDGQAGELVIRGFAV